MEDKKFECPHCHGESEKVIDERWLFSSERIQSSDDLNADPVSSIDGKIELWYCYSCGQYFRVYYKLFKISKLLEMHNNDNNIF
jgi:transcription elongation factor Elf1